jgi:hypothetical protein
LYGFREAANGQALQIISTAQARCVVDAWSVCERGIDESICPIGDLPL